MPSFMGTNDTSSSKDMENMFSQLRQQMTDLEKRIVSIESANQEIATLKNDVKLLFKATEQNKDEETSSMPTTQQPQLTHVEKRITSIESFNKDILQLKNDVKELMTTKENNNIKIAYTDPLSDSFKIILSHNVNHEDLIAKKKKKRKKAKSQTTSTSSTTGVIGGESRGREGITPVLISSYQSSSSLGRGRDRVKPAWLTRNLNQQPSTDNPPSSSYEGELNSQYEDASQGVDIFHESHVIKESNSLTTIKNNYDDVGMSSGFYTIPKRKSVLSNDKHHSSGIERSRGRGRDGAVRPAWMSQETHIPSREMRERTTYSHQGLTTSPRPPQCSCRGCKPGIGRGARGCILPAWMTREKIDLKLNVNSNTSSQARVESAELKKNLFSR